jgi:hypothetical protein
MKLILKRIFTKNFNLKKKRYQVILPKLPIVPTGDNDPLEHL